MSDRPCNYCIFQEIKKRFPGQKVELRDADFDDIKEYNNGHPGHDVYVDGVSLDIWFMAIGDHCEC